MLYTVADFGYLDETVFGTPIQPFEYFYMGGNGLVIATIPLRGYDDRTVGPRIYLVRLLAEELFQSWS